jgi:putative transposase
MRVRFLDGDGVVGKSVQRTFNNHGGGVRYLWNAMTRWINKQPANIRSKCFGDNILKKFVTEGVHTIHDDERKRKREEIEAHNIELGLVPPNIFATAPWLISLNAQVRQQVARDLKKAHAAGKAKQVAQRARGAPVKKFTFGQKKKSNPSAWTFCLPAKSISASHVRRPTSKNNDPPSQVAIWTKLVLPRNFNGNYQLRNLKQPPGVVYLSGKAPLDKGGKLLGDVRFTRDRLGRWGAVVQRVVVNPKPRRPLEQRKTVFLDPGSRAGNTYYSPDTAETGAYLEGSGGFGRIMGLCLKLDASIAQRSARPEMDPSSRFVKEQVKREYRIRERIRNLVNDGHKRMAKDLTSRFDTVVIPVFETQRMVRKPIHPNDLIRKINSKTARSLMTMAHYRFREYLKHRCAVDGAEFVLATEEYTTKACPYDGMCMDVGSSKTFRCTHCGFTADRDEKAAMCLAVKYLKA